MSVTHTLKISEFCKTGSGGTPSRKNPSFFENGNIPWVKSGELRENTIMDTEEKITDIALNKSSAKLVSKGSLLLAMYGATVGRLAFLGIDAATNQAICNIQPDKNTCSPKYLYYALLRKVPEFLNMAAGGAQPNISQTMIKDTEIYLPPLQEQKHIAAILDKADAIRRKRQQAIDFTDQLLRSVFLDMFGDPVTNPKGWPMGTIRDLAADVRYGSSMKAGQKGNFPILRMNNITYSGGWDFSDLKYIELSDKDQAKFLVNQGEILFNRTNSKKLVGKTAVYRKDDPMAFAGYLIRIRTNELANPEYIAAYLNSLHGKVTLLSMCKSIIGMANINAQEMQGIKIALPPKSLQDQYAEIVHRTQINRNKHLVSKNETDNLFNSLTQRAFRGELTKQTKAA